MSQTSPPAHRDVEIIEAAKGFERFLRMDVIRFRHRRFSGEWSMPQTPALPAILRRLGRKRFSILCPRQFYLGDRRARRAHRGRRHPRRGQDPVRTRNHARRWRHPRTATPSSPSTGSYATATNSASCGGGCEGRASPSPRPHCPRAESGEAMRANCATHRALQPTTTGGGKSSGAPGSAVGADLTVAAVRHQAAPRFNNRGTPDAPTCLMEQPGRGWVGWVGGNLIALGLSLLR